MFLSSIYFLNIICILMLHGCHTFTATTRILYHTINQRQHIYKEQRSPWNTPYSILYSKKRLIQQTTCSVSLLEDQFETKGNVTGGIGLYRSFADFAWKNLMKTNQHRLTEVQIPTEFCCKETVTPGPTSQSSVRITIQAASGNMMETNTGAIQYARYALIETIGPKRGECEDDIIATRVHDRHTTHTDGIQVLNMVIIPYSHTGLPVFGADFVSLPGNKHLLLLDAQPVRGTSVIENDLYDKWFQQWYDQYQIQQQYDWGGDLPEPVQQYVSKFALWTRFGTSTSQQQKNMNNTNNSSIDATINVTDTTDSEMKITDLDPIEAIQGPVMEAFVNHFQTYLQLLDHYESTETMKRCDTSRLTDYLKYRLENDPARPMLKRLFGAVWTEQVLHDILFPTSLFVSSNLKQ
jgi:Ferredoxin-dependent bilin reductase